MASTPNNTCPECQQLVPNCCCYPATTPDKCATPSTWCDDRLQDLPRKSLVRLLARCDGCFVEFERGKEGNVFVDKRGIARISIEGHDLAELATYLRDALGNVEYDGDGNPIRSENVTWPYIPVLIQTTDECGDTVYRWRKVRGIDDAEAYVFWDGDKFTLAGRFDAGICTSKVFDTNDEIILTGVDPDDTTGTVCLKKLILPSDDLLVFDSATGAVTGFNPGGLSGFVRYVAGVPGIISLCDIGQDDCGVHVPPTQFVGCSGAEETALKAFDMGDLPAQAAGVVPAWCPAETGYKPAPIGLTFWPAEALVREETVPKTGNVNGTVTELQLASATGEPVPEHATHARVRFQVTVETDEENNPKNVTGSINGIQLVDLYVTHYAATGSNTASVIASGTVALSGNTLPFALSGDPDCEYTYKIWLEGWEVKPCPLADCP